jgi:hypothetical protein
MNIKLLGALISISLLLAHPGEATQKDRERVSDLTRLWGDALKEHPQKRLSLMVESINQNDVNLRYVRELNIFTPNTSSISFIKGSVKLPKINAIQLINAFQNNPQVTVSGLEKLN